MLLLWIILFLNYDVLHFGHARRPRLDQSQPPVQMERKPNHDEEVFIRELREQMRRAQLERKGIDLDPDFGFGLDDYDISPMEDIRTAKINDTEQGNNVRDRPKGRNLALDNEEFLDYHITHMFWTGTPKVGETEQNTLPKFFLPTPVGFGTTTEPASPSTPDPWQNFETNLPGIETTSTFGPSDQAHDFNPGHHPEYPDQPIEGSTFTPFPPFNSNILHIPYEILPKASILPRPSFPFSVSPVPTQTPLTLIIPPTTHRFHIGVDTHTYWTGPLENYTPKIPTFRTTTTTSRTTTTTTPTPTTTTTVSTLSPRPPIPIPRNLRIPAGPEDKQTWIKIRPTIDKSLINLLGISVAQNTPIPQQLSELERTPSEDESWVHNKQWTEGSADGRTKIGLRVTEAHIRTEPHIGAEPPLLTERSKTPDPGYVTKATTAPEPRTIHEGSTRTANTLQLMSTDDLGFLIVSHPPSLPEGDVMTTPTTAGDVLHYAHKLTATTAMPHPNQKYNDMMKELDEGVLMVFLLEFTRILTEKEAQYVSQVMMQFEIIITHRLRSGHIPCNKFAIMMKKTNSPNCVQCGVVEDLHHLLMECVRYEPERNDLFRVLKLNRLEVGTFHNILSKPNSDDAKSLFSYLSAGSLLWLGHSLIPRARWLSTVFTESGPRNEEFVVFITGVRRMLKDRQKLIPADINHIIDIADSFYSEERAEHLFEALRDFENYPNVSYTGYKLCQKLIDNFMHPFRSSHQSTYFKELRRLLEVAIAKRFERRMFERRMFNQDLSKLTGSETARSNHLSKNKHNHSLKQRMEIKRRHKILTRRMYGTEGVFVPFQTDRPLKYPRLRSMLPITNNQKRFRVITQRQRAVTDSGLFNMERPTRNDHFRRLGRARHPYNEMMQFFPKIPREYLKHI